MGAKEAGTFRYRPLSFPKDPTATYLAAVTGGAPFRLRLTWPRLRRGQVR